MLGNLRPSARTAVVGVVDPDLNTAGAHSTGWVDMSDWGSLMGVVMAGSLGSSATLDAKLEQAQDGSGAGAKDIDGKSITQMTQAGGDSDKQAVINLFANELDLNNGFTHARLTMAVATASSDSAGLLLGFNRRHGAASAPVATPTPSPTPTPTPTPTISTMLVVSDSIGVAGGFIDAFETAYPGVTVTRSVQSGRYIGFNTDTSGTNSLWGQMDAIASAGADAVYIFLGANELTGSPTGEDILTRLLAAATEIKSRRPGTLVIVGTLIAISTSQSATGNARRKVVNAGLRAAVGNQIDAIVPLGEHPLMDDASAEATVYYGDGLHPSTLGQQTMGVVTVGAIGPIVDQETGSTPTDFTFSDNNNVALDTTVTSSLMVTGMGMGVEAAGTSTGVGDFKRGQDAYSNGPVNFMNGDFVTARMTSSSSPETTLDQEITVGGASDVWSTTTVVSVPVTAVPVTPVTTVSKSATVTTTEDGILVIGWQREGGSNPVNGVTIDGQAAPIIESDPTSAQYGIAASAAPLSAGNHTVVLTLAGGQEARLIPIVLTGAGATPDSSSMLSRAVRGTPHETPEALTVESGGLGVALILSQIAIETLDNGYEEIYEYLGYEGVTTWVKSSQSGKVGFFFSGAGVSAIYAASFS